MKSIRNSITRLFEPSTPAENNKIAAANAAAKEALEKKESQEAVDAAATALTNAMGKLVAAGDQTELKEVLAQANGNSGAAASVSFWQRPVLRLAWATL